MGNKNFLAIGTVWAAALFICMITGINSCSKEEQLTLRNEQFTLLPVGNSGVSGTVFVAENMDSSFNITIRLNSSVKDSVHIMNLYNNDQVSPSTVAVKLTDIRGTGGPVIGETKNIRQVVETTGVFSSVTYDKALNHSLSVQVFLSESRRDSVLCRGQIGR
jgi:hypothetical protein